MCGRLLHLIYVERFGGFLRGSVCYRYRRLGGRGFAGGEEFPKGEGSAGSEGLAGGGDRSRYRFRGWRVFVS